MHTKIGPFLDRPGPPPTPPHLHLVDGIWTASCPTCGFQLATGRTQARVERRAAGRVCPVCRDDAA